MCASIGDFVITGTFMFWCAVIAVFGGCIAYIVITGIAEKRKILNCLAKHPDDAYEFFASDTEHWTVYLAPAKAVFEQWGGEVRAGFAERLGPLEFRVPKLQCRRVSVFGKVGKGEECMRALQDFIERIDAGCST